MHSSSVSVALQLAVRQAALQQASLLLYDYSAAFDLAVQYLVTAAATAAAALVAAAAAAALVAAAAAVVVVADVAAVVVAQLYVLDVLESQV
jgi:hypothetical protein